LTARETLRRARRLEIRTRKLVQESLAGSYRSVFRGRGMEFAEVREYETGDDIRTVDWNVSARMGRPFVKMFTEERELTVILAVDASGSSRFGTGGSTKRGLAAEVSALVAFSAIRNNDRVGLLLFTDRVEAFLPPRKGREQGLRLLRDLLAVEAGGGRGTDLRKALVFLRRAVTKRAVVFLISDFLDDNYETTLRVVSRKHEIVAVSVGDPREARLPNVGLVSWVDPETGERGLLDAASPSLRAAYAETAEAAAQRTRGVMRRIGLDLLELSTGSPYEAPLVRFFRERARRATRAGA
jgi:uncharacterized protein (DUF58 family)